MTFVVGSSGKTFHLLHVFSLFWEIVPVQERSMHICAYAHAYSWSGKTLSFFLQVLFFYHSIWMTDNFIGTVSVSFISFIFLLFHKQTMILMALYQSLPIWTVHVSAFAYVWSPWWHHCLTLFSITLYITTAFYFAIIYWKCPAELRRTKTLYCKIFYGSMAPDLPIMFIISCAHTFKISHYTPADLRPCWKLFLWTYP